MVWTLPDPHAALCEWARRLRPGGLLILIEGRWREVGQKDVPYVAGAEALPWSGGITAEKLADAVRPLASDLHIEHLSANAALWGQTVTDERYALIART
ncbi:hypothetical protein [Streptomyces sp. NPDC058671]|uniref:hypothetical protein n=1 Tax=Streptomyces sp. NPDC058671 TaxID=3346590 RepID=UPI0036584461